MGFIQTHFLSPSLLFLSLLLIIFFTGVSGARFTLINRCDYTVWPGILGNTQLEFTGFELSPGAARSLHAPPGWSGRFWGRTGCLFDPATSQGSCRTADCGSNQMECNGAGATPPATLAEFTIGASAGAQDFYDVSLVDGYNIPMVIEATDGNGVCQLTGCAADLNRRCPVELRAGDGKACKSACEAFGNPEYCCSGAYNSPAACKPSVYSEIFKSACPKSYSYAFDDATSTFTCSGADYTITFCPSSTSQKPERDASSREGPSVFNGSWLPDFITGGGSSKTMVFMSSTLNSTLFLLLLFIRFV
ncbi:thaumatin-like protein 1 [Cucurbita maxima]|uniref:Thaumatin-like protein 1 n=1 Tax=Cucurbita maxima TaxID=3661 RepID=A0A6J1KNZ3_CUCMA|nr:thaumatin-like protein 1 [Cucurbita maxima]